MFWLLNTSLFNEFYHGAVGKLCVTLGVDSAAFVEKFEQVNTLKSYKSLFQQDLQFLGRWTHLSSRLVCVRVFVDLDPLLCRPRGVRLQAQCGCIPLSRCYQAEGYQSPVARVRVTIQGHKAQGLGVSDTSLWNCRITTATLRVLTSWWIWLLGPTST